MRRKFLKQFGLMAGAVATAPALPVSGSPSAKTRPVKVGVLTPQSSVYPGLAEHHLAGMKLYFDQAAEVSGESYEIIAAPVPQRPQAIIDRSLKLINNDRVDLLVGMISSGMAGYLRDVVNEHRTVLLVSNVGADVPGVHETSPYIFRNGLNEWQASQALGAWAADHLGTRALVLTSLYEAGYDNLYTFRLGFESGGGEVVEQHLLSSPEEGGSLKTFVAALDEHRPDFVFTSLCGSAATAFVQAYGSTNGAHRVPVLGSGFLADDAMLPSQGRAARGFKSCASWASNLSHAENVAFKNVFEKRTGEEADAFAVLGYDTARLLDEAVRSARTTTGDGIAKALAQVSFVGPRGRVTMNPETQSTTTPLYLREVRRHNGRLANVALETLGPVDEQDEGLAEVQSEMKSGWLNGYLMV